MRGKDEHDRPRNGATTGATRTEGSGAVLWQGHAHNRLQWLLSLLGFGVIALGILIAVEPARDLVATVAAVAGCMAVGLLVLAGTLAFTRIQVRIADEYLEVRYGHLGRPRRRIPLSQVRDCSEVRVCPRSWGGWGARWRPEQGSAVVVRRGPGLVLYLGEGKRFTITVDDSSGAVRTLRTVLPPGNHAGT